MGGMAEVFLGRTTGAESFSRPVVIKRILPQLVRDRDAVQMFLDEARLGARLHHEHIVPVLDLGEVDGTYFMVLAWVDGCDLGTLDARFRVRGTLLPPHIVAWIVAKVALGLQAAHDAVDPETRKPLDIVHRDVSPSNILVSRTGDIKVADFGVALSATQSVRTATGNIRGKVSYMSPEQLEGQPLDRRSDVYALGVVLWELLVGHNLHEGRNEVQVIRAATGEAARRASSANAAVPRVLDDLVARCLERDRNQRPPTARAVADALEAFCATSPDGTRAGFERWITAQASLFDVKDESSPRHRRTPIAQARALKPEETAPLLKRVKTPATPRDGLILAQRTERPRELILYVEDEAENRDVASLRLRRSYELLLATNDQEACQLLKDRGTELSAILMDIQLKGSHLNGIELVQLIRGSLPESKHQPYTRGVPTLNIPILFVTAYGARYSNDELIAAGAQRVVAKPVNFAELTLALVDLHLKKAARN